MDSPAERYAKEPVRYPALHIVDLAAEGAGAETVFADSP